MNKRGSEHVDGSLGVITDQSVPVAGAAGVALMERLGHGERVATMTHEDRIPPNPPATRTAPTCEEMIQAALASIREDFQTLDRNHDRVALAAVVACAVSLLAVLLAVIALIIVA